MSWTENYVGYNNIITMLTATKLSILLQLKWFNH